MHANLMFRLIRMNRQVDRGLASWYNLAWNAADQTNDARWLIALITDKES